MEDKPQSTSTILDKIDMMRKIAIFPALTVMIFLRRGIGFRLLKPNWLLVLAIIMIGVALVFPAAAAPFGPALIIYALAMLGWGSYQRWQRWKDITQGVRWHTYSPGISYLEKIPWPVFSQSHRRINRFVDPIAVCIVGFVALAVSHLLGLWLEVAALFLYVYEQQLYEAMLNHDLDILDGLIASEVQGETVKHFQQAQPEDKVRSIDDTAGIPTGVAPDIERLVAQRQAEFNAAYAASKAPDNLATDTPPPAAPFTPASPGTPPLDAPPSPQPSKGPDNLASDEPPTGPANPA